MIHSCIPFVRTIIVAILCSCIQLQCFQEASSFLCSRVFSTLFSRLCERLGTHQANMNVDKVINDEVPEAYKGKQREASERAQEQGIVPGAHPGSSYDSYDQTVKGDRKVGLPVGAPVRAPCSVRNATVQKTCRAEKTRNELTSRSVL